MGVFEELNPNVLYEGLSKCVDMCDNASVAFKTWGEVLRVASDIMLLECARPWVGRTCQIMVEVGYIFLTHDQRLAASRPSRGGRDETIGFFLTHNQRLQCQDYQLRRKR